MNAGATGEKEQRTYYMLSKHKGKLVKIIDKMTQQEDERKLSCASTADSNRSILEANPPLLAFIRHCLFKQEMKPENLRAITRSKSGQQL